jgi:hypothetical protein
LVYVPHQAGVRKVFSIATAQEIKRRESPLFFPFDFLLEKSYNSIALKGISAQIVEIVEGF